VPLGTHTGWNLYRAQPVELADRDGSFIPIAWTLAEREAAGDPRPSIEERYGSGQNHLPATRILRTEKFRCSSAVRPFNSPDRPPKFHCSAA